VIVAQHGLARRSARIRAFGSPTGGNNVPLAWLALPSGTIFPLRGNNVPLAWLALPSGTIFPRSSGEKFVTRAGV
jgi:hypothetical protein